MFTVQIPRTLQVIRRAKQQLSVILSARTSHQDVSIPQLQASEHKEDITESILFNSVLESKKLKLGWERNRGFQEKSKRLEQKFLEEEKAKKPVISVALKYLSEEYRNKLLNDIGVVKSQEYLGNEIPSTEGKIYVDSNTQKVTSQNNHSIEAKETKPEIEIPDFLKSEVFEDSDSEDVVLDPMQLGTSDPNVPASTTPCGGCGAFLHCRYPNDPGFVPREMFLGVSEKHLRALICQRCHFLKHYSTALNVTVSPEDYPKILEPIRKKRALVLLLVDLMDFPCSIWPQLGEVIGSHRPVCIVGNKVDLLPADSPRYLEKVAALLRSEVQRVTGLSNVDVKHTALVSALTGYGIEQLITKIHSSWDNQGDVYLVGCTNVGKSSLFNALINSDLCKVKAIDLVQRATTSPWPGTTLNLLKFPMMRPEAWRLALRTKRLISERAALDAQEKMRQQALKETRNIQHATLSGHVGRTFQPLKKDTLDAFSMRLAPAADFNPGVGLDPRDPDLRESRWCYDTPGTVQTDQLLHLLTEEELTLALPDRILSPQTFNIKQGQSVFIAGLGRLDYLHGDKPVLMTVFASSSLPLTVCWTRNADSLYSRLLGSPLLAVPCGEEQRLAEWRGLEAGPEMSLTGEGWSVSCADVLLSSAGWVSVNLGQGMACTLQAHTPGARGIHVRRPALLPMAAGRKGAKIRNSPAYRRFKPVLPN